MPGGQGKIASHDSPNTIEKKILAEDRGYEAAQYNIICVAKRVLIS